MDKISLVRSEPEYSRGERTAFVSILSGKGGVGKSVIAYNLAELTAQAGRRVLLIDTDRTGGNLHILANSSVEKGLAEFLSAALTLRDAVTPLSDNLDLLASPRMVGELVSAEGID